MSLYDFRASAQLAAQDWPADTLLMAAMRRADPVTAQVLEDAFPDLWRDFAQRKESPDGLLSGEAPPEAIYEPTPHDLDAA